MIWSSSTTYFYLSLIQMSVVSDSGSLLLRCRRIAAVKHAAVMLLFKVQVKSMHKKPFCIQTPRNSKPFGVIPSIPALYTSFLQKQYQHLVRVTVKLLPRTTYHLENNNPLSTA